MPKGEFIGLIYQFSIMSLLGFSLAYLLKFPPEISAGIVLMCSYLGVLASNVVANIARANLALSVTLTPVATIVAPLIIPL